MCRLKFVCGLAALVAAVATLVIATPKDSYTGPKFAFAPENVPNEPLDVLRFVDRPHQVIGFLLAALLVLIISGAKTDGGAVLDEIFILVLELGPDEAIPLTSATIFGGACCDFFLNLWKKPINSNSSLVDWDAILLMQPILLMGAGFGASLVSWLSTWLLLLALIMYLVYMTIELQNKCHTVAQEEGWLVLCGRGESVSLLGAPTVSSQNDDSDFQYRSGLPFRKLGINFGLFATTVLLTTAGKYVPSLLGIPPTSIFFLLVSMLPFIFLSVVSHYQLKKFPTTFVRLQDRRLLPPDEVQWSSDLITLLPLRLLGIGAIGGAFGVVNEGKMSQLLREVNMTPAAASAMSATAVFFISGMTSFDFFLWGKLDLNCARLLMLLGFVMTLFGRLCLAKIVRHANSRTPLLFAIASPMFVCIFPLILLLVGVAQ